MVTDLFFDAFYGITFPTDVATFTEKMRMISGMADTEAGTIRKTTSPLANNTLSRA